MTREHEHGSQTGTSSSSSDHDGPIPGKGSSSAQLQKPEHAHASGLVRSETSHTEKEQQQLAMQLEREASYLEERYKELIHQVEHTPPSAMKADKFRADLKQLWQERTELYKRLANFRRTGRINEEQAKAFEHHLDHLTNLEMIAQQKAHDKGVK